MAALMTIVNSPSVRMVIGSDSRLTSGLTRALRGEDQADEQVGQDDPDRVRALRDAAVGTARWWPSGDIEPGKDPAGRSTGPVN